jgi:hypothetical protein
VKSPKDLDRPIGGFGISPEFELNFLHCWILSEGIAVTPRPRLQLHRYATALDMDSQLREQVQKQHMRALLSAALPSEVHRDFPTTLTAPSGLQVPSSGLKLARCIHENQPSEDAVLGGGHPRP